MKIKLFLVLGIMAIAGVLFSQTAVPLFPLQKFNTWTVPASPPTGWTRIVGGSESPPVENANDWHPTDSLYAGSPWVAADSTRACVHYSSAAVETGNDWLRSPAFNPSAGGPYDSVVLVYRVHYDIYAPGTGDNIVALTRNAFVSWDTLWRYGASNPFDIYETKRINITARVAGATSCNIGFWHCRHWYNDDRWAIDDVCVYGYLPPTEPAGPTFSYACEEFLPMGTTAHTFTVNVSDFTGVLVSSVQMCYQLNNSIVNCYTMTYDTPPGSPPGTGTYSYTIGGLKEWDIIRYFFKARDTYSPSTLDSSAKCQTIVLGNYYVYEDGTGHPWSPSPVWIDPTGGTRFPAMEADDVRGNLSPLPWPVRFWGRSYTNMWVSTNGWVQVGGTDPGSSFFTPQSIPTATGPQPLVAMLWDDLDGSSPPGQFWYYRDPADRYFILGFLNWRQYGVSGTFNMELQVWNPESLRTPGNNSVFDVRFNTLPPDLFSSSGPECGVERWDGLVGTVYMSRGGVYGSPSYLGFTSPTRTIRYCTVHPPAGEVYGYVTLTGRANHSGATVGVCGYPFSTTTIASGYYKIWGIPPGTYNIYCTHPSFFGDTAFGVVVVDRDSTRRDFTLFPRPIGYIKGHADRMDTPGPDANILCYALGTGVRDSTDATGYYFLDGVPSGTVQVIGYYPGYDYAYSWAFEIATGETVLADTLPSILRLYRVRWDSLTTGGGGGVPSPTTGGWEWGTPTSGPGSARTAPNCWATILAGDYGTDADWKLDIPMPYPCYKFGWYQWLRCEAVWDGGNVKISKDGGATWELVNSLITPYNATASTANAGIPGQQCWSSLTAFTSWALQEISLTPDVTHVRFHFGSDGSIEYAGWYVDDFQYHRNPTGAIQGYVYDCTNYRVIAGAKVSAPGGTAYTNSSGYFYLPGIAFGPVTIQASAAGYWPNNYDATVFINDTITIAIPICPIPVSSLTGRLSHTDDDSITFRLCNPTSDTIWFHFSGFPIGARAARPSVMVDDPTTPVRSLSAKGPGLHPNAPSRRGVGFVEKPPLARPSAIGDVIDSFNIALLSDIPWGLGLWQRLVIKFFWLSNVDAGWGSAENFKYNAITGAWAGVGYDFTFLGGSSWMGDMAWDDNNMLMWQVAVGGSNKIYAFDVNTGAVVDSISNPTWTGVSQRGLGYDYALDVFYIGGWNDDLIYEIKGKSWDFPGQVLRTYSAPNCAGIGFDPSRRTIWYNANSPEDKMYEIDPNTGIVLNEIPTPHAGWAGGYALAGMECDHQGRIWIVNMNTRKVYVLRAPASALPGGMYVNPSTGYIAPGECITFALINPAYANPVGDYCFDLYFYPGMNVVPTVIPTCVQVQPRAPKGWSIISVPVVATPNNPYLQFVDDITPFTVDHTTSNIYGYNQDGGIFELPTGFTRGRGYYLLTWLNNTYWEVYGTPYAPGEFRYRVYYPTSSPNWGWWVIGNPFNARVDWDAVYAATDFTYLEPEYWTWSQNVGYRAYSPIFGGMGEDQYIDSWRGYLINTKSGNPAIYTDIVYPQDGVLETFIAKARPKSASVSTANPQEFVLRISAMGTYGSENRFDMYNYIAVNNLASDAIDDYDVHEPSLTPPSGLFRGYFEVGSERLMCDTKRNFNRTSKTWTFAVRDIPSGMNVRLMWPRNRRPSGDDASWGVANIDSRWQLTMTDLGTGATVNMRTDTLYNFVYSSGIRRFRITLSDISTGEEERPLPKEFALSANRPNPFNATTEFTVEIPFDSDVKVEVFNMLGKKVTTLVDDRLNAGYHRMVWDGCDANGGEMPSGVYLYKVVAGEFNETRKMTLIK